MKKDYTKIIFVVDRSGSMSTIANDVIGGYNKFISDQKGLKIGTCDVSFYQFDTLFETVYEDTPIDFVKELDGKTFVPRGGTALLDAVGKTIENVGQKLSKLPENERPDRVLFVILTDGEENSSRFFSSIQVKNAIEHQTKVYNWQFTYIGANQNAWDIGSSLGISRGSSLTYASNSIGTMNAFASLSSNTTSYRVSATKCFSYSAEDINVQKAAGVTATP